MTSNKKQLLPEMFYVFQVPKKQQLNLNPSLRSQLTLACAGAVHGVTDIGHAVDVVPIEPAALGADDVCLADNC